MEFFLRSLDLDKYVEDFRSFGFEYVGQLSGESEPSLRLICETFEMDAMETPTCRRVVPQAPVPQESKPEAVRRGAGGVQA